MKRLLKWIGYIIGGFLVIIIVFIAVIYGISSSRMGRRYPVRVEAVAIPTNPAAVERGQHLVAAVGKCANCHGDNLGGKAIMDDPVFARLWGSNLTRGKGGIGTSYNDTDYVRSIRYGVRPDGKPLLFMPAEAFTHFSDADLGAIIAYVKTVPAVDQTVPSPQIGPIARMVSVIGKFPLIPAAMIDRSGPRPAEVPVGITKEYGDYLAATGGCKSCHNPNLSGGVKVEGVATPNLTPAGIGTWSEADFMKVLRTGTRPDDRLLSAVMPWPYTKNLTDDEIRATWMYIRSLPPRQTGG
jgi:mono/diheme cytochrome c family protein